MKRPLMAAALAGALGLLPGVGQASTVNGLSCTLTGTSTWENPVTAALETNAVSIDGGVTCYHANVDGDVVSTDHFVGELTGVGSGATSCAGGATSGAFEAAVSTGEGTRDVWQGNFGTAGGALGAVSITVTTIDHQVFDAEAGEWVSESATAVSPGGAAGTLQSSGDLEACLASGISSTTFSGQVVGAFGAE